MSGFHVVNFIIHYLAACFSFLFIYNTLNFPCLGKIFPIAYQVCAASLSSGIKSRSGNFHYLCCAKMASMVGLFYIMVHVILSHKAALLKFN